MVRRLDDGRSNPKLSHFQNIMTDNNISTTYYQSPIGLLRIRGTVQYISEITFHDRIDIDENENRELYPSMLQCMEQLIEYFQGQRRVFEVPINQEGSPFQQKVWYELMNIRFGTTINYLEFAKRLGDPKCIRAAASANGKNNIAIIVPCHRVIGSNNDLVGYMAGKWRKKWLLELEKKAVHGVQTLF